MFWQLCESVSLSLTFRISLIIHKKVRSVTFLASFISGNSPKHFSAEASLEKMMQMLSKKKKKCRKSVQNNRTTTGQMSHHWKGEEKEPGLPRRRRSIRWPPDCGVVVVLSVFVDVSLTFQSEMLTITSKLRLWAHWSLGPLRLFPSGPLSNPSMITSTFHCLECLREPGLRRQVVCSLALPFIGSRCVNEILHVFIRSGGTTRPREHPAHHPRDPQRSGRGRDHHQRGGH